MFEIKRFLYPLIFLCVIFFSGCNSAPFNNIEEIHIKGVTWACNISASYAVFGSATISEDRPEVTITACEGDLLYMLSGDSEFYYRYNKEDGQNLVVTYDTSVTTSVYLNGQLSSFVLNNQQPVLELFTEFSDQSVKHLSTLLIRDELSDNHLEAIRKYEPSLCGTGLILEYEVKSEQLNNLVSICRPSWIVINGKSQLPDPENGKFLSDLELLWIDGDFIPASKLLDYCSNLESLIITDWDSVNKELIPLKNLKRLYSLTIAESGLRDLSGIEFPPSLRRLQLVMCDTLCDIGGLSSDIKLNSLILSGCDDIENPEVIKEVKDLQWLSFPSNINQSVFNNILDNQPSLEEVDILGCSHINDLSHLENHTNLKYLMLDVEEGVLSDLEKLNHLKLIVLSSEIFDKYPESVTKLRTALPDTNIIPGSGICLGSGWILLILPVILLSYILFRKEQNTHISEN